MSTPSSHPKPRLIKRKLHIHPSFHQTDMMGVIHNAVHLLWFEEGRMQILLEVLPLDEAIRIGVAMPVIENACAYHKAVRFGDPLILHTTHWLQPAYEGRLVFQHSLMHERDKVEMASGQTVTTLLDIRKNQLIREWPREIWTRYQALQ